MKRRVAISTALVQVFLAHALCAQGIEYVKAHYTKSEYQIPMRDGVRLFAAVYAPKDASKTYPILLCRTPYSVAPYGSDQYRTDLGPSEHIAKQGYIIVYEDVRGRYMSEGEFVNVRPYRADKRAPTDVDEPSDTYDTIDWLVKRVPGHNNRVGMWGISYPGFYAAQGAVDAHPALKAVSPQAPVTDWFVGDDFHHNGAFFLAHAFNFFVNFERPRPGPVTKYGGTSFEHGTADGYKFFLELGPLKNAEKYFTTEKSYWREVMDHPNGDEYWQACDARRGLRQVRPAVMTVGGWFDAEDLFGALKVYETIEKSSPGGDNRLVMGPWSHGGWARVDGDQLGDVRFNDKTGPFYREKIEFAFFQHYLNDQDDTKLPEVYAFATGTNEWHALEAWPPKDASALTLYCGPRGTLRNAPPEGQPPSGQSPSGQSLADGAFDEYLSDPARPVPVNAETAIGMTKEYMVADQRFAARRPDVLVYQTPPLEQDVTLAGPIKASLTVSTSGTDADWVVKLIDVYPDDYPDLDPNPTKVKMGGYQQLVRGEPMRGRFRNSFERPEAFKPGEPTKVAFTLPDACHVFRRGHRIMVQMQSSWFPLIDRNPQTFVANIFTANDSDFVKATQRVYRSASAPSSVQLTVVKELR